MREANVREETRAPSKGSCSIFIRIRGSEAYKRDGHAEKDNETVIINSCVRGRGFQRCAVLGVRVNTNPSPGTEQTAVYCRHQAPCLLILNYLGAVSECATSGLTRHFSC